MPSSLDQMMIMMMKISHLLIGYIVITSSNCVRHTLSFSVTKRFKWISVDSTRLGGTHVEVVRWITWDEQRDKSNRIGSETLNNMTIPLWMSCSNSTIYDTPQWTWESCHKFYLLSPPSLPTRKKKKMYISNINKLSIIQPFDLTIWPIGRLQPAWNFARLLFLVQWLHFEWFSLPCTGFNLSRSTELPKKRFFSENHDHRTMCSRQRRQGKVKLHNFPPLKSKRRYVTRLQTVVKYIKENTYILCLLSPTHDRELVQANEFFGRRSKPPHYCRRC